MMTMEQVLTSVAWAPDARELALRFSCSRLIEPCELQAFIPDDSRFGCALVFGDTVPACVASQLDEVNAILAAKLVKC